MSMIFTHLDARTQECDHDDSLGQELADGSRVCLRCGQTVERTAEQFTQPAPRLAAKGRHVRISAVG